jgi:hypothetical protein
VVDVASPSRTSTHAPSGAGSRRASARASPVPRVRRTATRWSSASAPAARRSVSTSRLSYACPRRSLHNYHLFMHLFAALRSNGAYRKVVFVHSFVIHGDCHTPRLSYTETVIHRDCHTPRLSYTETVIHRDYNKMHSVLRIDDMRGRSTNVRHKAYLLVVIHVTRIHGASVVRQRYPGTSRPDGSGQCQRSDKCDCKLTCTNRVDGCRIRGWDERLRWVHRCTILYLSSEPYHVLKGVDGRAECDRVEREIISGRNRSCVVHPRVQTHSPPHQC